MEKHLAFSLYSRAYSLYTSSHDDNLSFGDSSQQRVKGDGSVLVFKLLLTPFFIGLISLANRRWGTKVGGWLVGLPLTSAPVTLFIALELERCSLRAWHWPFSWV